MASFASGAVNVTFTADADSIDDSREARVAVQDIPGGDDFYVDRAGRKPQMIKFRMLLASAAEYGSLSSVIGASGSLAVELLDTHTVTLMRLSRPTALLSGQLIASAEWLVTA